DTQDPATLHAQAPVPVDELVLVAPAPLDADLGRHLAYGFCGYREGAVDDLVVLDDLEAVEDVDAPDAVGDHAAAAARDLLAHDRLVDAEVELDLVTGHRVAAPPRYRLEDGAAGQLGGEDGRPALAVVSGEAAVMIGACHEAEALAQRQPVRHRAQSLTGAHRVVHRERPAVTLRAAVAGIDLHHRRAPLVEVRPVHAAVAGAVADVVRDHEGGATSQLRLPRSEAVRRDAGPVRSRVVDV